MWTVTPEAASLWFNWFAVALVVGAVLVALGTYGTLIMGAAKEHFADVRISQNETETARAKEGAALASERAAQAELKLEQLRKQVSRRRLDRI